MSLADDDANGIRRITNFDLMQLIYALEAALESASWGCQHAGPGFPYFNEGNRPCRYDKESRRWVRCFAHLALEKELERWVSPPPPQAAR